MCIKTWMMKHLRQFIKVCNGDIVRNMSNEELATIIAMATFKNRIEKIESEFDKEKQRWVQWLDKEI